MAYVLDANVFIEAKNRHYGLDFCPAFWEWLDVNNASGLVCSIEKIADEIAAGRDDLATWAAGRGPRFFVKPDPTLLPALRTVSAWATSQRYEPAAVSTFLIAADYYLVAHALAQGQTLVTHEIAGTGAKRVKIPDACIGLGIKFMTPFAMLRSEHARFILGP